MEISITSLKLKCLSLSAHLEGVASDPGRSAGTTGGLAETSAFTETSRRFTSRSQTAQFTVLVNGFHDPVDLSVASNGLMKKVGGRVNMSKAKISNWTQTCGRTELTLCDGSTKITS